jgi:hypothetical protein
MLISGIDGKGLPAGFGIVVLVSSLVNTDSLFGNNSKTVSNIKNLTWGKNDQHIKIYLKRLEETMPTLLQFSRKETDSRPAIIDPFP